MVVKGSCDRSTERLISLAKSLPKWSTLRFFDTFLYMYMFAPKRMGNWSYRFNHMFRIATNAWESIMWHSCLKWVYKIKTIVAHSFSHFLLSNIALNLFPFGTKGRLMATHPCLNKGKVHIITIAVQKLFAKQMTVITTNYVSISDNIHKFS